MRRPRPRRRADRRAVRDRPRMEGSAAVRSCPRDSKSSRARQDSDPRDRLRWRRMCRNIRTLANFDPPATEDEIHASALQFVRKLSGTARPSRANQHAFDNAVKEVTAAARKLIRALATSAPPRNREEESRKAQERSMRRFA